MTRIIAAVLCALLCAIPFTRTRAEGTTASRIWDTKDTTQQGQLSIYNADVNGTLLGEPVGSGDLNGDGFADIVMAPFYAPSGPSNNRLSGGKLHIWFGGAGMLTGAIMNAADPPPTEVEVWGARTGDFLGSEVDVEDVTGDGVADILACAENADGFDADASRMQAGVLYVIPGRQSWPQQMNLSDPSSLGVIQILGAHADDRCGFWASGGDVNGDGIKDILVSADLARGSDGTGFSRGALYIIPGGPNLPARIDLGNATQVRELGITTIYGIDDGDHFGSCIASADFDGDGFADIAVSAGVSRAGAAYTGHDQVNGGLGSGGGDGPNNDRQDAGEAYVIYGRANWPATIQMASPPSDVAIYYGENRGDAFGEELHAGDFDGDGKPELAVGALLGNAPGRPNSGIGYIFWSSRLQRGDRVDLLGIGNSAKVTKLYAERANDIGADSLLLADVHNDGLADILFGSPSNTPAGRDTAGDLKVIFGTRGGLPPVVDFANLPSGVLAFQIIPPDPGDLFTYSLTSGDVDGDGYNDLIPNAMGGDGFQNRYETAGDAYVISGKVFSERAGRGSLAAPTLSRVTVSPDQDRYYAGQTGIELSLFTDASDPNLQFRPGAVAVIRGVEVATTFVSATELHVRLDDAPDIRNQAGTLTVQVKNPSSGPSAVVLSITLVGPAITTLHVKADSGGFTIKIKGTNFLEGATASVATPAGDEVPLASVTRVNSKKLRVRIASGAVPSGTELTVRVLNPGPAPSEPAAVSAP